MRAGGAGDRRWSRPRCRRRRRARRPPGRTPRPARRAAPSPSAPSSSRAAITATTGARPASGCSASNAWNARSMTSSQCGVGLPAMVGLSWWRTAPRPAKRGRKCTAKPSGSFATPWPPPQPDAVRYADPDRLALGARRRRLRGARRRVAPLRPPGDVRPDGLADLGPPDRPRRPVHDVRAVVEAAADPDHRADRAARRHGAAADLARRRPGRRARGARARLPARVAARGPGRRRDRRGRAALLERLRDAHVPRRLRGPARRDRVRRGRGPPRGAAG